MKLHISIKEILAFSRRTKNSLRKWKLSFQRVRENLKKKKISNFFVKIFLSIWKRKKKKKKFSTFFREKEKLWIMWEILNPKKILWIFFQINKKILVGDFYPQIETIFSSSYDYIWFLFEDEGSDAFNSPKRKSFSKTCNSYSMKP